MSDVYICDYVRTAIGRFGGSLSTVRTDDLAAIPIKSLMERNESVDWENVNDVYYGCANQAGEDNRNVARMASLLAGLPINVPGATINRLCGSGMDAILTAARVIKSGEADIILAGGVESMTRAPFVMPKSSSAFSRNSEIFDTTIGWRFINQQMKKLYGTDSMPETGENVAEQFKNRFGREIKVKVDNVKIGTEEVPRKDKKGKIKMSFIDIKMSKDEVTETS